MSMLRLILLLAMLFLTTLPVQSQTSNNEAHKFDAFDDIQASDLIARLDNYTIQLQQEPSTKGFIIVYRTRRDLPGLSNRLAHRMLRYLVDARGLPQNRLETIDGGVASCLTQELWIVPPGATPRAREDARVDSYAPELYKFDEHHYAMRTDPEPEINYWPGVPGDLFGYLEAFAEVLRKHPKATGYLVAFAELGLDSANVPKHMLATERNFLIKNFRVRPSQIAVMKGGMRASRMMELWVSTNGKYAPVVVSQRAVRR